MGSRQKGVEVGFDGGISCLVANRGDRPLAAHQRYSFESYCYY